MREIQITINIRCTDLDESFDVLTDITGVASTLEVVGLIELAKKQYIESKKAGPTLSINRAPNTSSRAPDGAPWYAHLDGPCGPECGHAPDGGNHPRVAGT